MNASKPTIYSVAINAFRNGRATVRHYTFRDPQEARHIFDAATYAFSGLGDSVLLTRSPTDGSLAWHPLACKTPGSLEILESVE
jgi:hypothetical protein